MKAGLRAASACGVAFEEYDDAGPKARLAPEQVATQAAAIRRW